MNKVRDIQTTLLVEYSNLIQKRNYCPFLGRIFDGNVVAAVLFQRLLYSHQRSKGQWGNKFYKFQGSCKHTLYKVGDSLMEELGTTRKRISGAFVLFGTVAKSDE